MLEPAEFMARTFHAVVQSRTIAVFYRQDYVEGSFYD